MTNETVTTPTPFKNSELVAKQGDYCKDLQHQLFTTGYGQYFRLCYSVSIKDLARALRMLQYFKSIDGNLDFTKEEILEELNYKIYCGGNNWVRNLIAKYDQPTIDKLFANEEKFNRALETVKTLFPEIKA